MAESPKTGVEVMSLCEEYTRLADELRSGIPCAVNAKYRQKTAAGLFRVCASLGVDLPQEFADECRAAVKSATTAEPRDERPVEWDMAV